MRASSPLIPTARSEGANRCDATGRRSSTGFLDFRSRLRCSAADGDTVWSEWRWQGTQSDGTLLDMVGVIVCSVSEGRISWARLYIEPVEEAGAGIESAVRRMTGDA